MYAFKVPYFMLSLHCTQRSDTAFLGPKLKMYFNHIRGHIMVFAPLRQKFFVKGRSKLWFQKNKPASMSEKCCVTQFEESQICTNDDFSSPPPAMPYENSKWQKQNTEQRQETIRVYLHKDLLNWTYEIFLSNDFSFLWFFI